MLKDTSVSNDVTDSVKTQSLVIDNTVTEIARMSQWLTDTLAAFGLSSSIQFRFDLCANEAVTNIISYAYSDSESHQIGLLLRHSSNKVILDIEDDGKAFNPFAMPEHASPKSLEEAKIGGLGIDLIRHYVDEYHYSRENNKNIISMVVQL